jgi:hypothetical protein
MTLSGTLFPLLSATINVIPAARNWKSNPRSRCRKNCQMPPFFANTRTDTQPIDTQPIDTQPTVAGAHCRFVGRFSQSKQRIASGNLTSRGFATRLTDRPDSGGSVHNCGRRFLTRCESRVRGGSPLERAHEGGSLRDQDIPVSPICAELVLSQAPDSLRLPSPR